MQVKMRVANIMKRKILHEGTEEEIALVKLTAVSAPVGDIVLPIQDPKITWHPEEVWRDRDGNKTKVVVEKETLIDSVSGLCDGQATCTFSQFSVYDVSIELAESVAIKPSAGPDGKPFSG